MGYNNPQDSQENPNNMGTLLGVHPIVPWFLGVSSYETTCKDYLDVWLAVLVKG